MQYLPLGNTGLYVSRICLGTMTFSEEDNQFADILGGKFRPSYRPINDGIQT